MLDVDTLIQFVVREREAASNQNRYPGDLADKTVVERGEVIVGLELRQRRGADIWMACRENLSRFRPGTRIVLHGSAGQFCGLVVHIDDTGTQLQFRMEDIPTDVPPEPWIAAEAEIDLSPLVVRCLRMLQPGAPGWSLCQTVLGGSARRSQTRQRRNATEEIDVIDQVLGEARLQFDATQRETVAACTDQPPILAVQGPPGTGKTAVLAMVAEILARLGRRVLVTAPTHQAINNALATVRRHFPSRRIVKVGDDVQRDGLPDDIQCSPLSRVLQPGSQQLLSATIVGMTFLSALQNVVARRSGFAPNVLLIDEASQVPLAQGVCGGLVGAGSVILFGDDAQMPPVFPAGVESEPAAVSLFAQLRQQQAQSIRVLDTTYRLNEAICKVVGQTFYRETVPSLHPSDQAATRKFTLPPRDDDTRNKCLVDEVLSSSEAFIWVRTRNSGCRQSNRLEAEFMADLVCTAIERGMPPDSVAVVSPFRLQSTRIRQRVRSRLSRLGLEIPIVDTVERVQGLSVEFVAISLCASDAEYTSRLASFLYSPNRLNVAISRARTKVIVAVTPDVLNSHACDEAGKCSLKKLSYVLTQAGATFDLT